MQQNRDAVKIPLPQQFVERLHQEIEGADELCQVLDGQSPTSVRFNPYKITSPPRGLEIVGWSRYGFYLPQRPSFTLDSAFHAGTYYVQEASSQFVGHILSQRNIEGAKVIDMCAAPGGKSTLYSTLVGLDGLVVANEINRQRAAILADNSRKWGLGNIVVSNNDTSHLAQFEAWADVVAVDAPCSGEGMFRKMEDARTEWSEANVKMCAERQKEILRNAWKALRPGGILIYSTCTFNTIENEEVVQDFVEYAQDEIAPYESVECNEDWGIVKSNISEFQCFRFFPHLTKGEGFFAAVACKSYDAGGKSRLPKPRKSIFSPLDKSSLREVCRWVEQSELMHFSMVADTIYGYYATQAESVKRLAESLTVIYSGVAMGQIFKGKLKPDGALALFHALNREAVGVATLDNDDILSYLRKAELSAELFDEEGVNLVCSAEGHAVGWVKRVGRRVNNLYPNTLRILK
ncbi:MAG: rRNA cytosine-C5-methylase [Rikenellaceae bacterium]